MRNRDNWMWEEACAMLERAERLQRQFFQPGAVARAMPSWEPPADVFESEQEVDVLVALPGVARERIEVRLSPGLLVVVGERDMPPSGAAIRRLEIPYGRFERRIPLPGVRLELVRQTLSRGCVRLQLRKHAP
jgi:HSP20 family molecular chaperone IbpA